jgi:hypothetical protein
VIDILTKNSYIFNNYKNRFHGTQIVDFDSPRGGISLETEKTESGTTSRLMLTKAQLSDSGNYTCLPTDAISASLQVHVLNGR